MYRLVVFIHVVSALLSLGPFFAFLPSIKKIGNMTKTEMRLFIDLFRFSVRLSKHAGHVLVASGFLLMWLGGWSWTTSWIALTLLVMIGSLYFFARAFSPLLRQLD
ncbi:MAG: DUF2269 family protein [Clostridia bacterium]